jgi:hypothetical protein
MMVALCYLVMLSYLMPGSTLSCTLYLPKFVATNGLLILQPMVVFELPISLLNPQLF